MSTKLLTAADLAERWGCDTRTVIDRVKLRSVPFVWLGKKEYDPSYAGPKFMRFRLEAIEAWEARTEKAYVPPVTSKPDSSSRTKPKLQGMPAHWDGKIRGGSKPKRAR